MLSSAVHTAGGTVVLALDDGEFLSPESSVLVTGDLCPSCLMFTVALKKVTVCAAAPETCHMGSVVHIVFAMELWLRLLHPQDTACLSLGQQLEESPGSLEFVYLSSGAPVLPKAPDPATKGEGRGRAGVWLAHCWCVDSKPGTEEQTAVNRWTCCPRACAEPRPAPQIKVSLRCLQGWTPPPSKPCVGKALS